MEDQKTEPPLTEQQKKQQQQQQKTVSSSTESGNQRIEVDLCLECIEWAKSEKRTFLRQSLEARLTALFYDSANYDSALKLSSSLLKELKKMDDKNLLVEVLLLESRTYHALSNLPKARAALTSARTTANGIYTPPKMQAALDLQSGILHAADERDFKTAFSYFYEAFEGFDSVESPKAVTALKYMLLSKIMLKQPEDVSSICLGKLALKYAGPSIDAMRGVASAASNRSLAEFKTVLSKYPKELSLDPIICSHLNTLYDQMMECNLIRILEPYSRIQVSEVTRQINTPEGTTTTTTTEGREKMGSGSKKVIMDGSTVISIPKEMIEKKLSQMILDKNIYGILDQGTDVLILFDDGTAGAGLTGPTDSSKTSSTGDKKNWNKQSKTFESCLETISSLSKVVDSLYTKAKKLS